MTVLSKKKIDVIILRGSSHVKDDYWYKELSQKLNAKGIKTVYPKYSYSNQTLDARKKILESYKESIGPKTTFVAHSLGVPLLLNYLETNTVGSVILVAGPHRHEMETWAKLIPQVKRDFETHFSSFYPSSRNWKAIKKNIKGALYLIYSPDDLIIDFKQAKEIQKKLGGDLLSLPKRRHFDFQLRRFPEIEKIVIDLHRKYDLVMNEAS